MAWRMVLGIAAMVATPATAEIRTVALGGVDFGSTPYTYVLGTNATITFTTLDAASTSPAGVSTGGTTEVASLGAPFYDPPQPTSYFANRGQSFGPGVLAQFIKYDAPAAIPFSIVEGLVGFRFDLGQGYQYGYADLAGSTLYGIRFETTPGASVPFGAVPEPSAWAMMITGFGLAGGALRLSRRRVRATA